MENKMRFACISIGLCLVAGITFGQSCRSSCNPPECSCSRYNFPMPVRDIPQMVYFGFDDAVNVVMASLYDRIFTEERKNPNGCRMKMSLFISHQYTDYKKVKRYYEQGHEIAVHSVTHTAIDNDNVLLKEAKEQRENLAHLAGVPAAEIVGWRSPFLKTAGNIQPSILKELGYEYDISLTYSRVNMDIPKPWPFTMDIGWPYKCGVEPCPKGARVSNFWAVPVVSLMDYKNQYPCAYVDGCAITASNEQEAFDFLWNNFMSYYNTTRTPFGLNMHAAWFYTRYNLKAMMRFLDELQKMDDTYVVTVKQMLDWMKNPTPLSNIAGLKSWNCQKEEESSNVHMKSLPKSSVKPENTPVPTQFKSRFAISDWIRDKIANKSSTKQRTTRVPLSTAETRIFTKSSSSSIYPTTKEKPSTTTKITPSPTIIQTAKSSKHSTTVLTTATTSSAPTTAMYVESTSNLQEKPATVPSSTSFPISSDVAMFSSTESSLTSTDATAVLVTQRVQSMQAHQTDKSNEQITNSQWSVNNNIEPIQNVWTKTFAPVVDNVILANLVPAFDDVSVQQRRDPSALDDIRVPNSVTSTIVEKSVPQLDALFFSDVSASKVSSNDSAFSSLWNEETTVDYCSQGVNCHIPHCYCQGTRIPNNLKLEDTPQMVYITIDDSLNAAFFRRYRDLIRKKVNPNGCFIRGTVFATSRGSLSHVTHRTISVGAEIAMHGIHEHHFRDAEQMEKEIVSQLQTLKENNISRISGWKTPELTSLGNEQYRLLKKYGFKYDATLSENTPSGTEHKPWPYTLDFGYSGNCVIPECPTNKFPGLWEIPNIAVKDYRNMFECNYIDGCMLNPPSVADTIQFLWDNFKFNYNTNRAPFGIHLRQLWFSHPAYSNNIQGLLKFIEKILTMNDVYLVSADDIITWIQNPVPVYEITDVKPWNCKRL